MIFQILFLISIVGIIILCFINKKNGTKKLLHYTLKSCNIDSIKFEKRFKLIVLIFNNNSKKTVSYLKRIFQLSINHKNNMINGVKKNIRKRLFSTERDEKVSEYISEIKK